MGEREESLSCFLPQSTLYLSELHYLSCPWHFQALLPQEWQACGTQMWTAPGPLSFHSVQLTVQPADTSGSRDYQLLKGRYHAQPGSSLPTAQPSSGTRTQQALLPAEVEERAAAAKFECCVEFHLESLRHRSSALLSLSRERVGAWHTQNRQIL